MDAINAPLDPFSYSPAIDTYEIIKMMLMLPVALCRVVLSVGLVLFAGLCAWMSLRCAEDSW